MQAESNNIAEINRYLKYIRITTIHRALSSIIEKLLLLVFNVKRKNVYKNTIFKRKNATILFTGIFIRATIIDLFLDIRFP